MINGINVNIPLDTGVKASYLRINNIQMSLDSKVATVAVSCYLSQDAFNNGNRPLASKNYTFSGPDYPLSLQALSLADPHDILYKLLLLQPDLAGAQAVII